MKKIFGIKSFVLFLLLAVVIVGAGVAHATTPGIFFNFLSNHPAVSRATSAIAPHSALTGKVSNVNVNAHTFTLTTQKGVYTISTDLIAKREADQLARTTLQETKRADLRKTSTLALHPVRTNPRSLSNIVSGANVSIIIEGAPSTSTTLKALNFHIMGEHTAPDRLATPLKKAN